MVNPVFSESLGCLPHIQHGFFTRDGGVSTGYLSSLNCNQRHDDINNVHENRKRVVNFLGGTAWVGVDQKHTAEVVFVDKPFEGSAPIADAIVTTTPGLVIAILTADCCPVLFADRSKPIIAAAHAGWQGALSGVIENTVSLMREKGATDIIAAIGPCIHRESYEVGPEFEEHFRSSAASSYLAFEDYFEKNLAGKFQFDLPGLVLGILTHQNVQAEALIWNTYADDARFFSYRRKTHHGEPYQGGQASAIVIR